MPLRSLPTAALALSCLVAATGCGSTPNAPISTGPQPGPAAATVFVERSESSISSNQPPTYESAILQFPATSSGSVTPGVNLPQTSNSVRALAVDATGNLYVGKVVITNSGATASSYVDVYAPNLTAASTPIRTLNLSGTASPASLFVDASGQLYVLNSDSGSVYVYPSGASGTTQPIRSLSGANTGIAAGQATGLYVDTSGLIYIANRMSSEVLSFAPSANGNVAPLRTLNISGGQPFGVAVNPAGTMYVSVNTGLIGPQGSSGASAAIQIFAPGATGSASPTGTIAGSATTLIFAGTLRLDQAGNLWATTLTQDSSTIFNLLSHVVEFSAGATGNVAPKTQFSSAAWGYGGSELAVE